MVTLDNQVDNQISEHLLSGKSLPINYQTYLTQSQSVSGTSFSVNVTRAVTRLSGVMLSFYGDIQFAEQGDPRQREWRVFHHPSATDVDAAYNPLYELEYQVQVGSKQFPEYRVTYLAESWAMLTKSIREVNGSDFHGIGITPAEYRRNKFIVSVNTSKMTSMGFTGLNTRSGDLMTIRVKAPNGASAGTMPTAIHVCLVSDQILEIRDTGVQVFD